MSELRTALSIVVPEAVVAVDDWRERTCESKPSQCVPPHVTLLFPFVAAHRIDERLLRELRGLYGAHRSFELELAAFGRFPAVLYLAPSPADRFHELMTATWARYPAHPPYEGAIPEPVPHLTVAQGGSATLDEAGRAVAPHLPIRGRVREVVLLEEVEHDGRRWTQRARMSLAP